MSIYDYLMRVGIAITNCMLLVIGLLAYGWPTHYVIYTSPTCMTPIYIFIYIIYWCLVFKE